MAIKKVEYKFDTWREAFDRAKEIARIGSRYLVYRDWDGKWTYEPTSFNTTERWKHRKNRNR